MTHLDDKSATDDAVAAAVDAGAAMMLVAPDDPSMWWVDFTGQGLRLALPVAVLSGQEAKQVADRLSPGSHGHSKRLKLELSGDQQVPYRYDVVQVSPHGVPERVVHTVSERNTATVTARYHEMGGDRWSKEQRFAWRPWQETTIVETQHELATPQSRTEYLSSGASDTLWRQHVLHYNSWDSLAPLLDGSIHELRTYRPGERVAYDWYRGVQRPAVVGDGATRTGDHLAIDVAEFVQGAGATYQRAAWNQEVSGRILEDGEVVAAGPGISGTYEASARSGQYQVELSTRRNEPDWTSSTATDTVWTFRSDRPRAGRTDPLPMMRVDYHVPVGLDNHVHTRRPFHQLRLTVDHPGARRVAKLEVWGSFDDGKSWDRLDVDRNREGGNSFGARIWHGGHDGAVSLKVRAVGSDGSTMTQSVSRAYGIG